MPDFTKLSLNDLKKHKLSWTRARSRYIVTHEKPEKKELHVYNDVIETINEAILNRALKEYKEVHFEKSKGSQD